MVRITATARNSPCQVKQEPASLTGTQCLPSLACSPTEKRYNCTSKTRSDKKKKYSEHHITQQYSKQIAISYLVSIHPTHNTKISSLSSSSSHSLCGGKNDSPAAWLSGTKRPSQNASMVIDSSSSSSGLTSGRVSFSPSYG